MKKCLLIFSIVAAAITYMSFTGDPVKPLQIPPNPQRAGDAEKGYQYLITGDYLKSGLPYKMFLMVGKDSTNYLRREGYNNVIGYEYTAVAAPNGELVVAPNCLHCHAQVFDGKLYVGMGNSFAGFTDSKVMAERTATLYKMLAANPSKQFDAARNFLLASKTVGRYMQTEVRGVNAADHLAMALAAHRDPVTFAWSDSSLLAIPEEVIPTDVPAWWLLKKKHAMFYTGLGRGDFPKFLMASNLLTVTDTAEAREVFTHFNDVLAYLYAIEAPKYPKTINEQLAMQGKALFTKNCSKCHGTYGEGGSYPNLLIPGEIVRTDSALYSNNYSSPQFIDWFKKSWFTATEPRATLVAFNGYIAPPLDGIWVTAPYFHNGSVPTLEGVLNSKARPTYWSRDFNKPVYDYTVPGWNYTVHTEPGKHVYNTTIKGYGNYGHYFGDKLSAEERKAVIEYLKTL